MYAVIWARTAASCERNFDCKLAFLRYLWMNTEGNIFRLKFKLKLFFSSPPFGLRLYSRAASIRPKNSNLDIQDWRGRFRVLLLFVQHFGLVLSCFSCKCVSSLFGVTHTIQSLFPGLVKLERVLQLDHKEGEDVLNHCPHLQLILLLIPPCEH